jgi:hypothetical protein
MLRELKGSWNVTGFKIEVAGYVGVIISGLPSTVPAESTCSAYSDAEAVQCMEAPCHFMQCQVIFVATIPPNASGDIDETISDGIVPAGYQDISVEALVCKGKGGCSEAEHPSAGRADHPSVSKLDIHLLGSPTA